MTSIIGVTVDACGRCAHYHSDRDIIANKCATCHHYWACHQCHDELADHPFGRMPLTEPAVLCGVCGTVMTYWQYQAAANCPGCRHEFNPGCSTHRHKYFLTPSTSSTPPAPPIE